MKKLLLIMFIASIMLFGCTQTNEITSDDLPPVPSVPGELSPVGQAGAASSGYAPNNNNIVFPTEIIFNPTDNSKSQSFTLSGKELIYKKGYYLNKDNSWISYTISGSSIGDWVKNSGSSAVTLSRDSVSDSSAIIFYGCSKVSGNWDCKWVAHEFNIMKQVACSDPDGESNSGFNVKGTTTGINSQGQQGSFVDYCSADGKVNEHSCSNNVVVSSLYSCPTNKYCSAGVCRNIVCTDQGSDINVKEKVTLINTEARETAPIVRYDYCSGNAVYQYNCVAGGIGGSSTPCPDLYKCADGACVQDLPIVPVAPINVAGTITWNLKTGLNTISYPFTPEVTLQKIKDDIGSAFDGFFTVNGVYTDYSKKLDTNHGILVKLKTDKTLTYNGQEAPTFNGIPLCGGQTIVSPDVCKGYTMGDIIALPQITYLSYSNGGADQSSSHILRTGAGYIITSTEPGLISCNENEVKFYTMSDLGINLDLWSGSCVALKN